MIRPCPEYEPLVEALLADELDHDGRERLLEHAMACPGCRSFVDLHHELLDVDTDDDLPGADEFAAMRRRVTWTARGTAGRRGGAGLSRRGAPRRVALAAAVAALLVAGFLAGWTGRGVGSGSTTIAEVDLPPVLETGNGDLLRPASASADGLEALGRSPYVYSNVSVSEAADGQLDLTFDVSRRVSLRGTTDDPRVRDVLLSTLLDPAPLGARLQAATLAARSMDPTVKQALLAALADDPSQAVRARCLELLAPAAGDPDVQQALVAVLRGDEAVGLRLQAIDLLAASDDGRARLGRAMEDLDGPDDRALVVRATNRLR